MSRVPKMPYVGTLKREQNKLNNALAFSGEPLFVRVHNAHFKHFKSALDKNEGLPIIDKCLHLLSMMKHITRQVHCTDLVGENR